MHLKSLLIIGALCLTTAYEFSGMRQVEEKKAVMFLEGPEVKALMGVLGQ